jgi:DNA-binding response OmpR family regulator
VRRFFSKRKDVVLQFEAALSYDADVNVMPADMLNTFAENNEMRLPVLIYGSHIFLRQAYLFGCSDFCKDPWSLEELELRLDKILFSILKKYEFSWGSVTFSGREVAVSGSAMPLTYQEMKIFRILVEQRGIAVPREVLFYSLWGNPGSGTSRVIDVHVAALRKKMSAVVAGKTGKPIISSVRNIGYIIE